MGRERKKPEKGRNSVESGRWQWVQTLACWNPASCREVFFCVQNTPTTSQLYKKNHFCKKQEKKKFIPQYFIPLHHHPLEG